MDTGTTIIKTELISVKDFPVNVFSDDTDILLLLIHHMTNSSTDMYNIYYKNEKNVNRCNTKNVKNEQQRR